MAEGGREVVLTLISHTNAGKTTLARTLLARDVGEVRDAPHVTEFADQHLLLQSPEGDRLTIWDTPGFGDSVRLARRLLAGDKPLLDPVGWFLGQVWDRWRDRPFWSAQQALRTVREEAQLVLYLVNAAESPQAAAYVAPEMQILGWMRKPVIVLLNQLGEPRPQAEEAEEARRWETHLRAQPQGPEIAAVMPLDAFARCWVQEAVLWQAVCCALPPELQPAMERLSAAWRAESERRFGESMAVLSLGLARSARAQATVPQGAGWRERMRQAGAALGWNKDGDPEASAQQALAAQYADEVRAGTGALIRLHGLAGVARDEVLARVASHSALAARVPEGTAALAGGALTGALAGLKADIATGGLTLGGGMLAGGVLGALGAAGLARAINLARGTAESRVSWSTEALQGQAEAALLRYLAVAHFGRGRGEWVDGESPPHWPAVVKASLEPARPGFEAAWAQRLEPSAVPDAAGGDAEAAADAALAARLRPALEAAARRALAALYPDAARALAAGFDKLPP